LPWRKDKEHKLPFAPGQREKMTETDTIPVVPKRRRRHRFGLWMLLSVAFSTALVVLAGLSLSGRELPAPTALTQAIATRVNAQMPAGRATFDRLALRVDERGVPQIVARNVGVYDARGAEVVRLNTVGIGMSVAGLVRGRLEPVRLDLSGAQMTLRRRADGQFDLSFGSGTGASGTLPGVLDAIDQVFLTPPLTRLENLRANALTITIEDQRSGRIWQVTDGRMQVSHNSDQLEATINFDVFNGTEQLAGVVLGVSSDMFTSAATIGATFTNAAARDIAVQSPILSFLFRARCAPGLQLMVVLMIWPARLRSAPAPYNLRRRQGRSGLKRARLIFAISRRNSG